MSIHDLIYPGNLADFQVGPRVTGVDPDTIYVYVEPWNPDYGEEPHFWSVYSRSNTGDVANTWTWVADFLHETDAREYAAWRAKES